MESELMTAQWYKEKLIDADIMSVNTTQQNQKMTTGGAGATAASVVNGKPTYTTEVTANPKGRTFPQALAAYARPGGQGRFIQDEGYITQYYSLPEATAALTNFNVPGSAKYQWPAVTMTTEEARESAAIEQEVNTYVDERVSKR